MLGSIAEAEWRKLQTAGSDAEIIRSRMETIVSGLAVSFADGNVPADIGISFTERNNSNFGRIYTPFGAGRFNLSWTVRDVLCGRLIAERETIDHREKILWEPLIEVIVPARANPYVGIGERQLKIWLERELGHRRETSLFSLGMSILYAFAQGPQSPPLD